MMRPFAALIAGLRYLFVLAVLALAALAFMSLAGGIVELVRLAGTAGIEMKPGSGAAVVPYFIRAAFLYFLSTSLCSLFVTDLPVPQWMAVKNLFQFRTKILTFVSIILPLAFMGRLMTIDQSAPAVLYSGGGVFLVLMGIFFLIRYGSPSGDEGMAREANAVQNIRTPPDTTKGGSRDRRGDQRKDSRPQGGRGREDRRPDSRSGSRTNQEDWLKKQKDDLKFQKESLEKAVDKEITGETGEQRPGSHVTVKPAPTRPRGRKR